VFSYAAGRTSFSEVHQYLDDAPSGTPSDDYNITLTVIDDDGGEASAETDLTVSNVAPEIKSLVSSAPEVGDAKPGDLVTVSGLFADLGTLDKHTAVIVWGDGTMTSAVIDETAGSFAGTHVYTTGGIFDIEVVLSDDDLGSAEQKTTALVTGARVKDGELQVVGTNSSDWVEINEVGKKLYKVHTDFLPGRCHFQTFDAAEVESIKILLGDGNDHASIAGDIDLPVTMDGGAGDDHLNAGRGPAVLIGGDGNDKLIGSRGDDKIYGGAGNDFILGGGGNDFLDGGSGNDKIFGSCGNDVLLGGDGNDRLFGGSGDDLLNGGPGNDRLFGGWGNDQLLGGDGNDLLVGGPGKDTLDGGSGKNKLVDLTCKPVKSQSCHDVKTPPCSSWVKSFVTDQCGDLGKNRPNEQIKIALPAVETGRQGSGNRGGKR
jgi:Ca2+-binding RTX toxin-like protein